ncbi:MAG: DMT family transporter [Lunatimonas sp.]|uniref:DMT family transporter n=1 Tax=Lunatimonas sp. TaxID=2060141 RepID=UPI00263A6868|nr:DMT family transporter [Lunatimonas sp.]MCC5939602.1 DMT family transporter [Lunatimonas sp.]
MPADTNKTQLKSWLLLILLSLIWGSSFILIKKSLLVFSPGEVGAFRIVAAGLVMLPLAMPLLKTLNRRQVTYLSIIGMVGSFIPSFLFAKAQTQLPSSLTGVLNALTPLMVVLIGAWLFGSFISRRNALGLFIAFLGVGILVLYQTESGWDILSGINFYAFFVLAATVCYGFNVNIIKFKLAELKPLAITAISLMMVLPLASIYLFAYTQFSFKLVHVPGAWLPALYIATLGIVGTAIALLIFNTMVKLVSPVFASTVTYLIPVVAIGWGVWDGESLLPWHFVGIAAVIAGVWVGNRRPKPLKT